MGRAYYSKSIKDFIVESESSILGELVSKHTFSLEDLQRDAWLEQIRFLKKALKSINIGHILFEYTIPRMGKRVDNIIILNGVVYVIEFKVGETKYTNHAIDQVLDYAIDLKNFHEKSHRSPTIPILVATSANFIECELSAYDDNVYKPIKLNEKHFPLTFLKLSQSIIGDKLDPIEWENSLYKPTPTIIEAAQALYRGHNVKEISRSDAGAVNLSRTSDAVSNIIEYAKSNRRKAICFITGVPGAGKTLAGLNIANERHQFVEEEHAVFLSGNGPLVDVLQEALARNEVAGPNAKTSGINKNKALMKARAFIQNIHHFRDDALSVKLAPIEKVVVFDEAQRAWSLEQTSSFMKKKKGVAEFDMSEPEFLISVMDRHNDWAVIICLIGGGQEINTGEAGLPEWFSALNKYYSDWLVFTSSKLYDKEYTHGRTVDELFGTLKPVINEDLHLSTSIRSFRTENLSSMVKAILDCDFEKSKKLFEGLRNQYPIAITRDVNKARKWLREKARGSERYGLLASSGADRLKPFGINVQYKIDAKYWFLNNKDDVRSSYYLEDVATEFDVQGLELDWTCVAWDADLRFSQSTWEYKKFRGTVWQNVNNDIQTLYLQNAYRVLLTRARQGMVIFVPEGSEIDNTRKPEFYDGTFDYLKAIGFEYII